MTSYNTGCSTNEIHSNGQTSKRKGALRNDDNETTTKGDNGVASIEHVPSIIELKNALPEHCFKSSLLQSLFYVGKDCAMIAALVLVMSYIERTTFIIYLLSLPFYWFLTGTLFWSLFVLGHDCGHSSFSKYTLVNDVLGNILHTFILVPYYPWKLSHHHHHKNTCNIDKEEVFYPVRDKDRKDKKFKVMPLFGFGLSWIVYLFNGFSPRNLSHFNPFEDMFIKHLFQCIISLACLCIWIGCLAVYGFYFGYISILTYYAVPCFVFMSWLVIVTFLHHHDVNVPWFADAKWSNVIGQLSTVDRHYGWAHALTHNIGTHQVHHLFSKIPHYRLEEATKVFREKYPHLVRKSNEPIMTSFQRMFYVWYSQRFIKDDVNVHVYK
ncbi:unnamed protein product [Owenia fusiformis]|uniref:Uncharacterized protein n=1 Tax=Owenia fusiformis TaxID=6347 RepID=A0A8J1TJJ7_OWEFU|nr:unnamed protein product [Owenia fusiformis]